VALHITVNPRLCGLIGGRTSGLMKQKTKIKLGKQINGKFNTIGTAEESK
jgi:hypothetical protein